MIQLTPAVKNIVIINVLIFALFPFPFELMGYPKSSADSLADYWIFFVEYFSLFKTDLIWARPDMGNNFQPIQIITHFFTHGGIVHIGFNMLFLIGLGPKLEYLMGSKKFVEFYLFSGIVGGILVCIFDPSHIRVVGASGALFGVLVAYAIYFPYEKIAFFLLPAFEVRKLVIGVLVISVALIVADFITTKMGLAQTAGISHFGHVSGAAAGFLYFKLRRYLPVK